MGNKYTANNILGQRHSKYRNRATPRGKDIENLRVRTREKEGGDGDVLSPPKREKKQTMTELPVALQKQ